MYGYRWEKIAVGHYWGLKGPCINYTMDKFSTMAVAKISRCWVYEFIVGGELHGKEVLLVLFSFCFL